MRLSKEEYREAEECLKKYNYNCITVIDLREDIMSISSAPCDGLPKAPYLISDSVFNAYMRLQEDKELKKTLKQLKAVENAKHCVRIECLKLFENFYRQRKTKWETMDIVPLSQRTFERRKKDLIYAVAKELKKLA